MGATVGRTAKSFYSQSDVVLVLFCSAADRIRVSIRFLWAVERPWRRALKNFLTAACFHSFSSSFGGWFSWMDPFSGQAQVASSALFYSARSHADKELQAAYCEETDMPALTQHSQGQFFLSITFL